MACKNIKKNRRLSKNEFNPSNEKAAIKKCGTATYFISKTNINEKTSAMTDEMRQIFLLSRIW